MKDFLLDTNVISELRKGSRADANVRNWAAGLQPDVIYLSVITLAEIRKGVVRIRSRDPQQAAHLEGWRARLEAEYAARARLLPVDALVGQVWGDLQGERHFTRWGTSFHRAGLGRLIGLKWHVPALELPVQISWLRCVSLLPFRETPIIRFEAPPCPWAGPKSFSEVFSRVRGRLHRSQLPGRCA